MTRSLCFLFIIFFLCFTVHACNARSIRFRNAGSPKEFFSCKLAKKLRTTMDSFEQGPNLIGSEQSNKMSADPVLFLKPKKIKGLHEEMKYVSGRSSDASWHVPRRNHDKYPGFYADYSRPRTRPPSHN